MGAAPWLCTLQFGRLNEATAMLDDNVQFVHKVMDFPTSAGYMWDVFWSVSFMPVIHHVFGLKRHAEKNFATLGFTFDNVDEKIVAVTEGSRGVLYTSLEHKGTGGGLVSLKRCSWQVKSLCILNLDVPDADAVAWLESLPADNEEVCAYTLKMPNPDNDPTFVNLFGVYMYQTVWIALAHEKVGLYEGALRFADLHLEPDARKGGTPMSKWDHVVAWACKGRVLAKLGRHDEALVAFQAAIATSKQSYSLMEAFAYRELSNYTDGGDAAVQAGEDLDRKLSSFEGRISRAEFDGMTIRP